MINKIKSLLRIATDDDRRRKELLFDKLNPGDIFIDCGANVGQETIPALKKGAIVYAFEPHPEAFAELKKRVNDNKNAHLYAKGVWHKPTKIKLFLHQNHEQDVLKWSQGASFVDEKENVDRSKFVEVDVIDLADFIDQLDQRVKVLKIDVEGVEFDILSKLIEQETYKKVDYILVETHSKKMKKLKPKEDKIKLLIAKKKIQNISLDWV